VLIKSESIPRHLRAHAAMNLCELHTLGLGSGQHDVEKTLHWLHVSATLGHRNGSSWYYRVCCATGIPPVTFCKQDDMETYMMLEERLSFSPASSYLINRIYSFNANLQEQVRNIMYTATSASSTDLIANSPYKMAPFNEREIDTLGPLHLAAWLGDDDAVLELLHHAGRDKSDLGLNAAHYACLGGHFSTLRILADHGVNLLERACHDVTPLHLVAFMSPESIDSAVHLLIESGAPTDAPAGVWMNAHDLGFMGTPLEWAVSTRNLALVKCLMPYYRENVSDGLGKAIDRFYWEIAEELMPHCNGPTRNGNTYCLNNFDAPFAHWIAHGRDHALAIEKTIHLCHSHKILDRVLGELSGYFPSDMVVVQFDLVEAILSVASEAYVKLTTPDGYCAFPSALEKSKHDVSWRGTLQALTKFYSVEELQEVEWVGLNALALAVFFDSTVGARVLLEKGMDVNYCDPSRKNSDEPPIMHWIHGQTSPEMFLLLTEYGAEVGQSSALAILRTFLAAPWKETGLKIFLDHAFNDGTCARFLQETHKFATIGPIESQKSHLDVLRLMLTRDIAPKHIDDVDGYGCTMLQRSAYHLNSDTVRVLLEAGANPCVPFVCNEGRTLAYPLQLCCTNAWLLRDQPDLASQAMEIATELLESHTARGDGLFQGITSLHLAHYAGNAPKVARLLSDGYDPEATACWPSVETQVTPRELSEISVKMKFIQAAGNFLKTVPPKRRLFLEPYLEKALGD